jgi:hypothetical protein
MIMLKLSHGVSTAIKTQRPIMVSALSLRSGGYLSNLAVKPIPRALDGRIHQLPDRGNYCGYSFVR